MDIVGIALGILIGVISGFVFLLLFRTLHHAQKYRDILPAIPELLGIPTFWFGGPWLTTALLKIVELNDIFLRSYILSLMCTFVLIIIMPLFRFVIMIGNEIGRTEEKEVGYDV
jgi:ABC-type arginine transport system permease subunit